MAHPSVICIDSDGDCEESAVVISDGEEDVIFINQIHRPNLVENAVAPSVEAPLDLTTRRPENGDCLNLTLQDINLGKCSHAGLSDPPDFYSTDLLGTKTGASQGGICLDASVSLPFVEGDGIPGVMQCMELKMPVKCDTLVSENLSSSLTNSSNTRPTDFTCSSSKENTDTGPPQPISFTDVLKLDKYETNGATDSQPTSLGSDFSVEVSEDSLTDDDSSTECNDSSTDNSSSWSDDDIPKVQVFLSTSPQRPLSTGFGSQSSHSSLSTSCPSTPPPLSAAASAATEQTQTSQTPSWFWSSASSTSSSSSSASSNSASPSSPRGPLSPGVNMVQSAASSAPDPSAVGDSSSSDLSTGKSSKSNMPFSAAPSEPSQSTLPSTIFSSSDSDSDSDNDAIPAQNPKPVTSGNLWPTATPMFDRLIHSPKGSPPPTTSSDHSCSTVTSTTDFSNVASLSTSWQRDSLNPSQPRHQSILGNAIAMKRTVDSQLSLLVRSCKRPPDSHHRDGHSISIGQPQSQTVATKLDIRPKLSKAKTSSSKDLPKVDKLDQTATKPDVAHQSNSRHPAATQNPSHVPRSASNTNTAGQSKPLNLQQIRPKLSHKLSSSRRLSDTAVPPKKRKLLSVDVVEAPKLDTTPTDWSPETAHVVSDDEDDVMVLEHPERRTSFVEQHDECTQCDKMILHKDLLYCPCGTTCCNKCLEKKVTNLLAKGEKGLPECGSEDCNQVLDLDKLHLFLPPMVMTILRKKIDEEMIGNIKDWLKPRKEEMERKDMDRVMDLPEQWAPMHEYQDFVVVPLDSAGQEYIDVHNRFHETMHNPRAQISSIKRVQNPTLWRFYAMKRHQMMKELAAIIPKNLEQQLFHGTRKEHTDAICGDNFDWRMCGVHGTAFGMGSYFARDASYSHRYTDQPGHGAGLGPPSLFPRNAPPPIPSLRLNSANTLQNLHNSLSNKMSALAFSFMTAPLGAPIPPVPLPMPPTLGSGTNSAFFPVASSSSNIPPTPVGRAQLPVNQIMMTNKDPLLNQGTDCLSTGRPKHTHVMFLAKVLTGRFTQGRSSYRKPPTIDINCKNAKCFDSCVNHMNNPYIYVVFEKSQCYPEYMIEYTNLPHH